MKKYLSNIKKYTIPTLLLGATLLTTISFSHKVSSGLEKKAIKQSENVLLNQNNPNSQKPTWFYGKDEEDKYIQTK